MSRADDRRAAGANAVKEQARAEARRRTLRLKLGDRLRAAAPEVWGGAAGRTLSVRTNSALLMLNTICGAGFGALFWLLAARLFEPREVGLASGAIAAILLCVHIASLGTGSAIVSMLPGYRSDPSRFLSSAINVVCGAGLLTAGAFLLLASRAFRQLGAVASEPIYSLAFLAMGALWTASLVFDETFVALRRADQILLRSLTFLLVRLALLVQLGFAGGALHSRGIFLAWTGAAVASCLLAIVQLRRTLDRYRYLPLVDRRLMQSTFRVGLPNWALTLALLAPGLVMPLVVTERLSPTMNAYWYSAWMISGIVYMAASSSGMTLFAEASNDPEYLRHGVTHGIKTALLLGVPSALGAALLAQWVLPLLGSSYTAAAAPLRVLVLGILPITFIDIYVAACRSSRRIREAVAACALNGVAAVAVAATLGVRYGLVGVAASWIGVQCLTGLWAGWRLWSFSGQLRRRPHPEHGLATAIPTERRGQL